MKGNKKILVIAVLLLLIAVSYTTYAIYKTSVAGNAEVSAAAWTVAFKNGQETIEDSSTITFTGADCTNTHVAEGKIAPGATCRKTISLDVTGTEVDVAYSATAGAVKVDGNTPTDTNEFSVDLSPASGTINMDAASKTQNLVLEVTWAGTEGDSVDSGDTGLQGKKITVPVTLIAKQVVGTTQQP